MLKIVETVFWVAWFSTFVITRFIRVIQFTAIEVKKNLFGAKDLACWITRINRVMTKGGGLVFHHMLLTVGLVSVFPHNRKAIPFFFPPTCGEGVRVGG